MSVSSVLVVLGASVGKTATVEALSARAIPAVQCFHLTRSSVPSAEVMQRDHGSGEGWQVAMTAEWMRRLGQLPSDVRVAVLDGQTRPSYVLNATAQAAPRIVQVVLFDYASAVRKCSIARPAPARQAELANHQIAPADPAAAESAAPCSSFPCRLPYGTARACSPSPTVRAPSIPHSDRRCGRPSTSCRSRADTARAG